MLLLVFMYANEFLINLKYRWNPANDSNSVFPAKEQVDDLAKSQSSTESVEKI